MYITALVMIPLFGLGVLSAREIERNDVALAVARDIEDAAAVHASAAATVVPLEIERMASIGLARLDEFGADRALVTEMTGLDFTAFTDSNDVRLESALDALVRAVTESESVSASLVADLQAERVALDSVRGAVSDAEASPRSVEEAFARMFATVETLLFESERSLVDVEQGALSGVSLVRRLGEIVDVVLTARQDAESFSTAVFSPAADGAEPAVAALDTARHLDALSEASLLEPTEVADLQRRFETLPPYPDWLPEGGIQAAGVLTPERIDELSEGFLVRVGYLEAVAAFVQAQTAEVNELAGAQAVEAGTENRSTLLMLAGVGFMSLILAIVIIRSFAGPLRALRHRAEEISAGSLSANQLDLDGPSDIRSVTAAVNDMALTLSLVDEHMRALSVAEHGDDLQLSELPGEVGASMRTSMHRVTELTAQLQESEAMLAERARLDALTGLPNRYSATETLDLATARFHERADSGAADQLFTGVLFVDVDGFKTVNDIHGHAAGDVVLVEIARRLRDSVRPTDSVFRLGGDEFLVIAEAIADPSGLLGFGRRLIEAIERPYEIGEQLFGISASVGATVIEVGDAPMSAVERADAAVYQAKRHGRRRVEMFDKRLQQEIEAQAEMELGLRQAIINDELRLHLQPVADMVTGRVAGAEALVRWERPGVGLVPPNDFIPIAERSGLIFDVERWVLEAGCRRIAEWRRSGRGDGMRLAINISGKHLVEGDLLGDLDHALRITGADPSLLEIELTESQLLDDVDHAIAVLDAVRSRGVRVAIDDFGTGYSSMTYLQKLPVDAVKIDRSFIAGASSSEFDSTIIESIVTIGRTLDLDIVAEGIETQEQLEYAIRAGVTMGQGFLFARPLPIDEAEKIMFGPPLFRVARVRSEDDLWTTPWATAPVVAAASEPPPVDRQRGGPATDASGRGGSVIALSSDDPFRSSEPRRAPTARP